MLKLENTGDASVTEHLHSVGRFCLEDLILLWDFSFVRMALGRVRGGKFSKGCLGVDRGDGEWQLFLGHRSWDGRM